MMKIEVRIKEENMATDDLDVCFLGSSTQNVNQSNVVKSIICIFYFVFHGLFSTQTLKGCLMQRLSAA